ncbi:hypothetical protein Chor_005639 [Crotalus horridus]
MATVFVQQQPQGQNVLLGSTVQQGALNPFCAHQDFTVMHQPSGNQLSNGLHLNTSEHYTNINGVVIELLKEELDDGLSRVGWEDGLSAPSGECAAGFHCIGGSPSPKPLDGITGNLCPPGTYCPVGSTAPSLCPPGTFSNQFGQSAVSDCQLCHSGFYCEGSGLTFPTGECKEGYYCDSQEGPISNYTLYPCPEGHYCPPGTQRSTQFSCPLGTFGAKPKLINILECQNCPPGKYCSSPGLAAPTGDCAAGFWCKGGAHVPNPDDGVSGQPCPAGHYCLSGALIPLTCPDGTWSGDEGNPDLQSCKSCPGGHFCNSTGLVSPSGLCDPGFYCIAGSTTPRPTDGISGAPCPVGHYCPSGSEIPTPCLPGTYMAETHGKERCPSCPERKYCIPGHLPQLCPKGFYCPEGTGLDWKPCPPGTYNPVQGIRSVIECQVCDGGKFCQYHNATDVTGECWEGFYCTQGSDRPNPIVQLNVASYGILALPQLLSFAPVFPFNQKFIAIIDQKISSHYKGILTILVTSPDKTNLRADHLQLQNRLALALLAITVQGAPLSPILVQWGHLLLDQGYIRRYFCLQNSSSLVNSKCPVGHYCPLGTMSENQFPCPQGTYNPNDISVMEQGLPLLLVFVTQDSIAVEELFLQDPIWVHSIFDPDRIHLYLQVTSKGGQCPPGHYCVIGTDRPQPCPAGSYNPFWEMDQCLDCPEGAYCNIGSANYTHCPAGHYCPKNTKFATQFPCPRGTYSEILSLRTVAECQPCPSGKFCSKPGLINPDGICMPGWGRLPQFLAQQTIFVLLVTIVPKVAQDLSHVSLVNIKMKWVKACAKSALRESLVTPSGPCLPGYYCILKAWRPNPVQDETGNGRVRPVSIVTCPLHVWIKTSVPLDSIVPKALGPLFHACPGPSIPIAENGISQTANSVQLGISAVVMVSQFPSCVLWGIFAHLVRLPAGNIHAPEVPMGPRLVQLTNLSVNPAQQVDSASTLTDNDICPRGHFCPLGTGFPIPCPPGSFSAMLGLKAEGECLLCPTGYICSQSGTSDLFQMLPCNEGYVCLEGNSVPCPNDGIHGYRCPKGFYCPQGTSLEVPCEPGVFSPTDGASVCLPCPAGTACRHAATVEPVICPQGFCTAGFYCAGGAFDAVPQSSPEFPLNGPCPQGHFCPEGTQSPIACPLGTLNNGTGGSSPDYCVPCYPGFFCAAMGLSSPTGPCTAGFYCPANFSSFSPTAFLCPEPIPLHVPLENISPTGVRHIVSPANPASTATRLLLGNPSIAHHIPIVLKVLWFLSLVLMAPSLFQMFLAYEKREIVFLAPLVTTAGEGGWKDPVLLASSAKREVLMLHHRVPTSLGLPRLIVSGEKVVRDLVQQYKGGESVTTCVQFQKHELAEDNVWNKEGFYCPEGSVAPIPCPDDTTGSHPGAKQKGDCLPCPPGRWCKTRYPMAFPCPFGSNCQGMNLTNPLGPRTLQQCPKQTFRTELETEGQPNYQFCLSECQCPPAGTTVLREYPCAPGHWCPSRKEAFLCPPGSYRTQPGATSLEDCLPCPPGFFCPDPEKSGVPNILGLPCEAGYECPLGSSHPSKCRPGSLCGPHTGIPPLCPAGYYCPDGSSIYEILDRLHCKFPPASLSTRILLSSPDLFSFPLPPRHLWEQQPCKVPKGMQPESDGSCICQAGYLYYDERGEKNSDSNSDQDCQLQEIPNTLGPDHHIPEIQKVHLTVFGPRGVLGFLPTNPDMIDVYLSGDSQPRYRRDASRQHLPTIPNPVACLVVGDAILFQLGINPSKPGTYVLRDNGVESRMLIVVVNEQSLGCNPHTASFQPSSPYQLARHGVLKHPVVNIAPDWATIAVVLFILGFLTVMLTALFFLLRPPSCPPNPMKMWKPRWRSLGEYHIPSEYVLIKESLQFRTALGPQSFGEQLDVREESFPGLCDNQFAMKNLEDFSVRTLYDKLEDQNLHLASQLAKHRAEVSVFYRGISQKIQSLWDMIQEVDLNKPKGSEEDISYKGTQQSENSPTKLSGVLKAMGYSGAEWQEATELMKILGILLQKIQYQKIAMKQEKAYKHDDAKEPSMKKGQQAAAEKQCVDTHFLQQLWLKNTGISASSSSHRCKDEGANGEDDNHLSLGTSKNTLIITNIASLSSQQFLVYRFGCTVAHLMGRVFCLPALVLLLAETIPQQHSTGDQEATWLTKDLYYDADNHSLYILSSHLENAGVFVAVLLNAMAHRSLQNHSPLCVAARLSFEELLSVQKSPRVGFLERDPEERLSVEMFITVLHGEHKADLFNIHCKVQILLDGIKHRCGCEEEIELADESGQVKNLLQNKYHYATELLGERETYVLLSVTNGEKASESEFRPLLKDEHIVNPKFLAKLGSCQEHKGPSPRMKSRRIHRKSTLDIPTAEGIRNASPHGNRTRTPNLSPKQSKKN